MSKSQNKKILQLIKNEVNIDKKDDNKVFKIIDIKNYEIDDNTRYEKDIELD